MKASCELTLVIANTSFFSVFDDNCTIFNPDKFLIHFSVLSFNFISLSVNVIYIVASYDCRRMITAMYCLIVAFKFQLTFDNQSLLCVFILKIYDISVFRL